MASSLVKPCLRGANLNRLTDKMRVFIVEYLADSRFDATNAARKAGYKQPQQAAGRLMRDDKIRAILGKAQREREERCLFDADDVWRYITSVLLLNPFDHFMVSESGSWIIDNPSNLPQEVAQLVEGFEQETVVEKDGNTTTRYKVRLITKTAAMILAAKCVNVEKHEIKHTLDWDGFYDKNKEMINTVEARLIEEEKINNDHKKKGK